MIPKKLLKRSTLVLGAGLAMLLASCSIARYDAKNKVLVSVRDQKMVILNEGVPIKSYRISTSKFGLGDKPGSKRTPIGTMKVARKIGAGAPSGAVFKSRRQTGEVLRPNAPGRDPIVSRIIWLKGMEGKNRNAFRRYIYIHGTPEERTLGRPASFGCIRMKSRDVIDLYKRIGVGSEVRVIKESIRPEWRPPMLPFAPFGPKSKPLGDPAPAPKPPKVEKQAPKPLVNPAPPQPKVQEELPERKPQTQPRNPQKKADQPLPAKKPYILTSPNQIKRRRPLR